MATISVLPGDPPTSTSRYKAIAGDRHAFGATAGQALDALESDSLTSETTLVVLQRMSPDAYFSAAEMDRLGTLMAKWREARDASQALDPIEQIELEALVKAEVAASGRRAAELLRRNPS